MTTEEYLSKMKPGYQVNAGGEEHQVMHEMSQRALQITMELNNKYHTHEEIVRIMSELTGEDIDDSFGLFPPFIQTVEEISTLGKMFLSMQAVNFRTRVEYTSETVH